jgi:uncharacterized membrane protein
MKRTLFIAILFVIVFNSAGFAYALGMMNYPSSFSDTTTIQAQQQEELEGKGLFDDLNNKLITCSQLKDADFEKIGEYFMGISIGDVSRHIATNEMMKRMMGEQGEEQAHTVMGKRMSNCETAQTFSQNTMMGFGGNYMMPYYYGNNWSTLWLVFLIGMIVLIIWTVYKLTRKGSETPTDILQKRYAKGEITKKQLDGMKKEMKE